MIEFTPMQEESGRLIALVDDEENIRETVGYALKRAGYRVDLYADGAEAWARFETDLPDITVKKRTRLLLEDRIPRKFVLRYE